MNEALFQSLILTLVGMIVIFIFMGALIVIIHFYVKFAGRFFPNREEEEEAAPAAASASGPSGPDGAVIAAISAALRGKNTAKD